MSEEHGSAAGGGSQCQVLARLRVVEEAKIPAVPLCPIFANTFRVMAFERSVAYHGNVVADSLDHSAV